MLKLPRLAAKTEVLTPQALRDVLRQPVDEARLPLWPDVLAAWPDSREHARSFTQILQRFEALRERWPLPQGFPLEREAYARYRDLARIWLAAARFHTRRYLDRPDRFDALAALFDCLRQSLVTAALAHQPWPTELWPEIHRLYLDARPGSGRRDRTFAGAARAYQRLLLLGLADLAGLHPREVAMLDALSEKWAPLVTVEESQAEGWRIDPEAAVPARWQAAGTTAWRVNLETLFETLAVHQDLASAQGRYETLRQPSETIDRTWLETLLAHWRGETPGFAPAVGETVELVSGLTAIFEALQGGEVRRETAVREADRWRLQGGTWQVGDLIAAFSPGGRQRLQLRVVSHLHQPAPDEVVLAWRPLAGQVQAVGVQPAHLPAQTRYQRALLLTDGETPRLLLAAQPLAAELVVLVLIGQRRYPVRLVQRRNSAWGILDFRCLPLQK